MDDATADELRCASRALPGAPGALLAVRLAPTASHLAAVLRVVRALAGRRELRDDDLVHERNVDLNVEQRVRQVDRAGDVAGR